jgi:hypothetical protein
LKEVATAILIYMTHLLIGVGKGGKMGKRKVVFNDGSYFIGKRTFMCVLRESLFAWNYIVISGLEGEEGKEIIVPRSNIKYVVKL